MSQLKRPNLGSPELEHITPDLRGIARPIGEVVKDVANLRIHSPESIQNLKDSYAQFSQRKNVVVQVKKDGTKIVRAGNGTLEAGLALGWKWIAAVYIEEDDVTATAFAIADNRTAELSRWDLPALHRTLETLDRAVPGVNNELLEMIQRDLEPLQEEPPPQGEDPGPGEVPVKASSIRGEIYELGVHRLMCGDATSGKDVERLMSGQKAALFSTDPPYLVDYTGNDRPNNSGKDWSHVYKEVEIKDAATFFRAVFENAIRILLNNAAWYCWHAHKRAALIEKIWDRLDVLNHQQIIWVKPTALHGHSFWPYQHEPCLMGWRRGNKPDHDGDNSHAVTTIWHADWDGKSRPVGNEHPTEKPTRLFEIPINKHTKQGDIVYEPFSGSGSQLIAAAKLGRRCYAMDISPEFCDVTRKRWTKYAKSAGIDPGKGALE